MLVYYLPLDTRRNARKFMEAIKPGNGHFYQVRILVPFFNELHKQHVPLIYYLGIFQARAGVF
jgi:3-deoxy-D-manno-octulosonic-acid transferase